MILDETYTLSSMRLTIWYSSSFTLYVLFVNKWIENVKTIKWIQSSLLLMKLRKLIFTVILIKLKRWNRLEKVIVSASITFRYDYVLLNKTRFICYIRFACVSLKVHLIRSIKRGWLIVTVLWSVTLYLVTPDISRITAYNMTKYHICAGNIFILVLHHEISFILFLKWTLIHKLWIEYNFHPSQALNISLVFE